MKSKSPLAKFFFAALYIVGGLIATNAQSPRPFSEVHVLRSLRQIHSAQATFQATTGNGNYGSLQDLQQAGLIDGSLATGSKYGYLFIVSRAPFVPGQSAASFTVTATPRVYRKTGTRSFFIDEWGEIRGGDLGGQLATAGDPYIDDCTTGGIADNERCTLQDMRTLHGAEATYQATVGYGNFGTFPQLRQMGFIRSDLADYSARGYLYRLELVNYVPGQIEASFKIWATPQVYGVTGVRSFLIGTDGVLYGADRQGGPADENDPPVYRQNPGSLR